MKKLLTVIAGIALLFSSGKGQTWKDKRYELTGSLGATQFFGDIGGFTKGENFIGLKDFSFRQTRINAGVGVRYHLLKDLAARISVAGGFLHSTDARGSNPTRAFESTSLFFEPSLIGEYYIINQNEAGIFKGSGLSLGSLINLYVFTGAGGMFYHVHPNAKLATRATRLDGFAAAIPLGLGTSLNFTNSLKLGAELGRKFLFSDNVDGYTSKYSRFNDVYYFLNLTVAYRF